MQRVAKGEKGAEPLVFEHAKQLRKGLAMPLTLSSHPGKAVVPLTDIPHAAGNTWSIIGVGVGPSQHASHATFEQGFLTRTPDERVLDIDRWSFHEGNRLWFLRSIHEHPRSTRISKSGRSGRQFRLNRNGTLSPMKHKHLVLGITSQVDNEGEYPCDGDALVVELGDQGSRDTLILEHADRLRRGEMAPLTLVSHEGQAIVCKTASPKPVAEWSVFPHIGVGRAEVAINAHLIGNEFLTRVDDDRCFDIHHWRMHAGNRICLLRSQNGHPKRTRTRISPLKPGGRSFSINADGSISPKAAPHLVLCKSQEAQAIDYTLGAALEA